MIGPKMSGVHCEICNERINVKEPMVMFSPERIKDNQYMHSCCYQEILLCEIWGALQLDIQYKSGCSHINHTSKFDPLKKGK